MRNILLVVLLLVFIIPVLIFGFLGFVPGLSTILGANKPRDLGIKYTQKDLTSVRSKSHLEYKTLPQTDNPLASRSFSGKQDVKAEFSSEEITATMNNQPWKYWPYQDVQVKFNKDGSGEISGIFLKDKLVSYGMIINAPTQAIDFAQRFLPSNPAFYVKLKATLVENSIATFEPQNFEIGRMPMPIGLFLASGGMDLVNKAYAQSPGMDQELAKVKNKRQLIIDFIDRSLTSDFGQFYAKSASFGDNKLIFDGILTESISYTP